MFTVFVLQPFVIGSLKQQQTQVTADSKFGEYFVQFSFLPKPRIANQKERHGYMLLPSIRSSSRYLHTFCAQVSKFCTFLRYRKEFVFTDKKMIHEMDVRLKNEK
jgi:hypothetical protein